MKRVWMVTAIAFTLGSSALSAQNANVHSRARAALPAEQAREFDQIVSSARTRGLPIEPLADKVLEGRAKGVAPATILGVVRARSQQLGRAAELLQGGGPVTPAEITVVADAMQRGVKPDMVRKVRGGGRPGEPAGMALNTLADLMERGVPANVAFDVISAWRDRGARAGELRQLPATVERLVREGARPEHAGNAVISALRAGRSAASARVGNAGNGRGKGPPVEPPGRGRGRGNGGGT